MEDFEVMAPMWKAQGHLAWDNRFDLGHRTRDVSYAGEAGIADTNHLIDLMRDSDAAIGQLTGLVKQWDTRHKDTVSLLQHELEALEMQRVEAESKRREILQEHIVTGTHCERSVLEQDGPVSSKRNIAQAEDTCGPFSSANVEECQDTLEYSRAKAQQLNKLLAQSLLREELLHMQLDKLRRSSAEPLPMEELQQQLERVDNFLHFILRNAPIVIAHQDKDLRYRFVYNQYPGLQAKDILGKRDDDFYVGTGSSEATSLKLEVMRRGLPAKREIVFNSPDFGTKAFLMAVEPVFSREGEVIGVNVVAMDVTEEAAKREKLIALREEAAVQRAMETELHKTIHITEETMRAKQLLATMSHEIRTPLSGVVSMAEILATTKLNQDQQQLVDVMLTSGDLVLQLINDILDLSKVESGAMKLEAKKFRPREVVKTVLQMAVASAQTKCLTLEGLVVEEVPFEVIGDVLRIRQIFINLISNAIKFTQKGIVGVVMRVIPPANKTKAASQVIGTLDEDEPNIIWLHCEVFDTGIGIPESSIPVLFKRYMQASATHARKYGGTGLGLAICKQLVELMGGELKVASKENEGSTFSFTLPCKVTIMKPSHGELGEEEGGVIRTSENGYFKFTPGKLSSRPTSLQQIKALPYLQSVSKLELTREVDKNEANSNGVVHPVEQDVEDAGAVYSVGSFQAQKQPKILLVEDNNVNVMVALTMLKRLGLQPEVVGNGADAVKAVKRNHYDLILMDICMPIMDGLEATRLIREHENACNKKTPIIAMTANALAEDVAECYARGMDSFVAKPATFKRLEHVLRKFLSHLLDNHETRS